MEIDLSAPRQTDGEVLRRARITERLPDGRMQMVEAEVWVKASDSISELSARTREAAVALLQRALDALNQR